MTGKTGAESVGLKGAKRIGDRKVSSLLQFSWARRHDSSIKGAHMSKTEGGAHAEPSVSKERSGKKNSD